MKQKRYHRKVLTFIFAEGAAGADLIQEQEIHFEAELLNILQINSSNAGTRTAQVILLDEDDNQIFDGTAKAHNASYNHEFGVTVRRILYGTNTVKVVISGDPGAGGATIQVVLSLTGIDG
jgi:hypothetical protein